MSEQETPEDRSEDSPNVAYQLADYLESVFVPASTYAEVPRGFTAGDFSDVSAWRRHGHAVDLVRQVDDAIRGLEAMGAKTAFYHRSLPKWYAAAYAVTAPLGTAVGPEREACDEPAIDVLRGLAERLDETGAAAPVTTTQRAEVRRLLDQLTDLLHSDVASDLPADIRLYLWNLIARARSVMEELTVVGVDEARRTMAELGGALAAQATRDRIDGNPERSLRFGQIALLFMAAFIGQAGADAWEITVDAVQAITGRVTDDEG